MSSTGASDGAEVSHVEVDGRVFDVIFRGFAAPLSVFLDDGTEVTFVPWTCAEHLKALAAHVTVHESALVLDPDGLAGEVLARNGIERCATTAVREIALWWAAGGAQPKVHRSGDWIALGGQPAARARLRAWTWMERLRALHHHTRDGALDLLGYLEAMVATSVVEVEPVGYDLGDIDSAGTAALLDAVIEIDVLDPHDEIDEVMSDPSPMAREQAVATLRLCRALGWTPSQVYATPAPEVDRLLDLLDRVEGGGPVRPGGPINRMEETAAPTHGRSVAGHSAWVDEADAIVIRIEQSEEGD